MNKFTELQKEIKRLELPVKSTLAEWTGKTPWYIGQVFAGNKSFSPKDMDAILAELGYERTEAGRLFPPYGAIHGSTANMSEEEAKKHIYKLLSELYG